MYKTGQDDWTAAMRRGDFERAWAVSDVVLAEWRARGEFDYTQPRHLQTIWDGRPLARQHVLVRCYHGLGDTVMFIRFARRLRAIAQKVSVWAQPELLPLIARAEGVDRVLPLHDGVPDVTYDVDIEVMELAHALRVTRDEVSACVPYLSSLEHAVAIPPTGCLRVGLIWAAGNWDPGRSVHFATLEPLLRVPGVAAFSLQRGTARSQIKQSAIPDIATDDVERFAATLRRLDLIISVDTFAAHLAGAMGLPVWTLLRRNCDWRWTDSGRTTPWYPTMRLFRQQHEGDWRPVVEEMTHELSASAMRVSRHSTMPEQRHPSDVRPV